MPNTLSEWQQKSLQEIDLATARLIDLAEDLLDVTRVQVGRLELHRELVEQHGGRIWLESTEGRGSIFFVALPLTSQTASAGFDTTMAVKVRCALPFGRLAIALLVPLWPL